jgi:uncharacterized membrane protein
MEDLDKIAEHVMGMTFVCGLVFFVVAIFTLKFPPKSINSLYGCRTPNSMKSQESWDFAQRFSSIKMIKGGLFLMMISLLKLKFVLKTNTELILSMILIIGVVIYFLVTTEKAIKKNFPND